VVVVSEIAWMGTTVNTNDEWIELFNDGTDAIDLADWTLEWGTKVVTFDDAINTTLVAGGYYILERTNDDTLPSIIADNIYAGALGNSGEVLALKNAGTSVWQVDASEGWPAGDNSTKSTMQWDGSGWITAQPTPRAGAGVPQTLDTDDEEETDTTNTANEPVLYNSPLPDVEKEYTLELFGPTYAAAGTPIQLRARGVSLGGAEHVWAFGDGDTTRGATVSHTYSFAGEYAPVVRVRRIEKEYVARAKIVVFESQVEITQANATRIELKNNSRYPVELYAWRLEDKKRSFTFPRDTVILPGANISISRAVSGIGGNSETGESIILVRPDGVHVASRAFMRADIVIDSLSTYEINNKMADAGAGNFVISSNTIQLPSPDASLAELEDTVARASEQVQTLALQILAQRVPVNEVSLPSEQPVFLEQDTLPLLGGVIGAFTTQTPTITPIAINKFINPLPPPSNAVFDTGLVSAEFSDFGLADFIPLPSNIIEEIPAPQSTTIIVPRANTPSFLGRIGLWFDTLFGLR